MLPGVIVPLVSSRGRPVFDFTSLTDEGIGVQSPDILNRAQWLCHLVHIINIQAWCLNCSPLCSPLLFVDLLISIN